MHGVMAAAGAATDSTHRDIELMLLSSS